MDHVLFFAGLGGVFCPGFLRGKLFFVVKTAIYLKKKVGIFVLN